MTHVTTHLDAEFVIAGAGLAGAATAYALAQRGAGRVLIVEREAGAGWHASGRNAAMVRSVVDDPAVGPAVRRGAAQLAEGKLAPYRQTGGFLIGARGTDDVQALVPAARGRGRYIPEDGVVEVAALLETYLAGQRVQYETTVTGFQPRTDHLVVETNRGALKAQTLVNAAGAWAGALGDLPLRPLLRHLYVTPPHTGVDPDWPFVWDVQEGLYFRPESQGLLLCACDEQPTPPGEYAERLAVAGTLADKVSRLQAALVDLTHGLSLKHRWTGQRTFAPDRRFVIGFDRREPRLYWVAGLGGHGVTASYAVGELAAAELTDGAPAATHFDPGRLVAAPCT